MSSLTECTTEFAYVAFDSVFVYRIVYRANHVLMHNVSTKSRAPSKTEVILHPYAVFQFQPCSTNCVLSINVFVI